MAMAQSMFVIEDKSVVSRAGLTLLIFPRAISHLGADCNQAKEQCTDTY